MRRFRGTFPIRSTFSGRRAAVTELRARLGDPRLLIADRHQRVDELTARLERRVARELSRRRTRLEGLDRRLAVCHPRTVVARGRGQLEPLRTRLLASWRLRWRASRARLDESVARLEGLSPLSVLDRGYAIAMHSDGRAIRAASEVRAGDAITVRLRRGALDAAVTSVRGDSAPDDQEKTG